MSARTIAWWLCLGIAIALAATWGQLPTLESDPLQRIALFAGMGLCLIGTVFLFPDTNKRRGTLLVIGGAVLLRIVLLPSPVSDDVNRYLWEGKLILAGESPYAMVADDSAREPFQDEYRAEMNHRDRPTVYPPGIQWILGATVWIAYHPGSVKVLALIGDLATLALILVWLRIDRAPVRWAGFWAFNPIVLISFAAEAHFDSLMTAALVGGMLASRKGHRWLAWLLLGCAIQIKLICVVLVPALLTLRTLRSSWVLVPVLLLPSLPFLHDLVTWWSGISEFAGGGHFNGPLTSILQSIGLEIGAARALAAIAFGLIALGVFVARQRSLSSTDAAMLLIGSLILCSPIVHFWYLSWVLPFACLRPSFGWTMASITSAGYFLAWWTESELGWWGFQPSVSAMLWTLPLLAFVAQNRRIYGRIIAAFRSQPRANDTIDIVIPTLNPGPRLQTLVASLRKDCPADTSMLISDGGSDDGSLEGTDATIVSAPAGRGGQIARGIAETKADWIMILHSDAFPEPGWHARLTRAIATHGDASMLVLGQRFTPAKAATLPIEMLNELRVVFGGVAFGDQTMIIRRSALEQTGGFPEQPLMEDVEVSLRLRHSGRIIYLGQEWNVSAAKWRTQRPRRFLMIIRLVFLYQVVRLRGRDHAARFSEKLYAEYYGSASSL